MTSSWILICLELFWLCYCNGLFFGTLNPQTMEYFTQNFFWSSDAAANETRSFERVAFIFVSLIDFADDIFRNMMFFSYIILHFAIAVVMYRKRKAVCKYKAIQQRLRLQQSLQYMNKIYGTTFSLCVLYDIVFLSLSVMPHKKGKFYLFIRPVFVLGKLFTYGLAAIFSNKVVRTLLYTGS